MTQGSLWLRILSVMLSGLALPAFAQRAAVELPELTHKRLLNDFQIVVASTPYLGDNMTIGLVTRYGAAFDPAEKGGLAQITTQLIGRATQDRMGVSFHVGSQCMRPTAFQAALAQANRAIVRAGVMVDVVDVGGGFPSVYPGMIPPDMADYLDSIDRGFAEMSVHEDTELWAEPGRALVAEATSMLTKVELRKGRIPLAEVVRQAVETCRPVIEEAGHDLSISAASDPLHVDADDTRLAQVFANLLHNAAKFTEPGGCIRLTVDRDGDEAVVSVRDNGVGIPDSMLPRVFDMFTQVDRSLERSQGGLGIGLSLVKGLVELHGGTIAARSEGLGKGSEFEVTLPLRQHVEPGSWRFEASSEEVSLGMPAPTPRQILVVDDNSDEVDSLAMLLRLHGHEVRTAQDGEEALQAGRIFEPQVVMLDLGMPGMDGFDTARRIRSEPWGQDATLVAVTGWGRAEDRERSSEAGFDYHLPKPVAAETLLRVIAEGRPSADHS